MARQMKDSGIEWIGEIPETWKATKAKYLVHINHGTDPMTEGDVPVYGSGAESFKTCGEYKEGPTVLIGRKGATLHIPHYVEGRYWNVDTAFDVNVNRDYVLRMYYYAATCFDYKYYMSQTTLPGMTQTNYNNMALPCPSLLEQHRIADFLDRKCAEIDSVIERTKATIEEYKKLKQAVITEAVTKGVRGPRPMKDSGIEWIGEIPEGWDSSKLGGVTLSMRNGYVGPTRDLFFETGIRYIQSLHIKDGVIDFDKHPYYVAEEWANEHPKVHTNDILIVQTGDIGQVGIVEPEYDGCNCHALIIATPDCALLSPRYLMFYLMSIPGKELLLSYKTGALLPHLNAGKIKFTPVLLPTLDEQNEIAFYLAEKCSALDTLIAKKTALLTELETYKKSLIYEYVTGKRECPEAVEQATAAGEYPYFPAAVSTKKLRFAQAMMMAKVLDMHGKGMGRVKLEKMLYTIETSIGFNFDTEYVREAAGPLHESIYKCEGIISRQNHWYQLHQSQYGVSYTPTKDAGKYRAYYDKYFSSYNAEIERIIDIFKPYSTDQAEIVATLFAAWNDAIIDRKSFTDEDIVDDVLNNWHDNKKRFPKDVWLRAMEQMRKNNLIPKGYGKHTVMKAAEM